MEDMDVKKKTTFGGWVGKIVANTIVVCISTCILAILITMTYSFLSWIFRIGGIL